MAVVRVTAVSAGAIDYLINGSGCVDQEKVVDLDTLRGQNATRDGGIEYQVQTAGEPAGRWLGSGLSMLGVAEGAQASAEDVRAVFGRVEHLAPKDEHGRVRRDEDGHEVHGDPLGRRPRRFVEPEVRAERAVERARAKDPVLSPEREAVVRARALGQGRKAVAYYDVTFSPDKSVSVYWAALHAAGATEQADAVAAAHDAAVREAAAYLEKHVAYTRGGRGSVAVAGVQEYQQAEGLVMIPFRHSTSRENEPQLHTHLAVLNRVVSTVDGKIRALDGQGFAPVKEAAAEAYEQALARGLREATGAVMAMRPDGVSRRIVGVEEDLCRAGSTRREDVVAQIDQWVADYRVTHGREPGAVERREMAQAAVFKTRPAKQGPGGPDGFREWSEAQGTELTAAVGQVADAAAGHVAAPLAGMGPDGHADWPAALRAGIDDVQRDYAAWYVGNLARRVSEHLPDDIGAPSGTSRIEFVHQRVAAVLADGAAYGVVPLGPGDAVTPPPELAGLDGRSRFRPPLHADRYATTAQLAAEHSVVAATRAGGAPAVTGAELELLRVELAASGLGGDQVEAVLGIVASGRRADVLIGPAGTGKSHTVGELARVWSEQTGGRVLGLATSELATRNLREDGLDAVNTTVFLLGDHVVRAGDLVIVDEAGMSSTAELEAITRRVSEAGGKLLFTGDHHQLASVGAGGMLAQLVEDAGAFELVEVHRFAAAWEREASLGLRRGDPAAAAAYAEHGRLRSGTAEDMRDAASRGWLADTLAGRRSLLIVGTNRDAAQLSERLREQLVAYGRVSSEVITTDADHNPVGVGDLVQVRRNDWAQRIDPAPGASTGTPVGRVLNRDTYTVLGPDPSSPGGLLARRSDGATVHLNADYVAAHTHLAYASTVHAAQGLTVTTTHSLVGERAHCEDTYTAASRGWSRNTIYVISDRVPDEHDPDRLRLDARTALVQALSRQSAEPTAEMTRRAGEAQTRSLAWIAGQWDQVHHEHGHARYRELLAYRVARQHGGERAADLATEAGYDRLIRAVHAAELRGHRPEALLDEVVPRTLSNVDSAADVLRYRINRALMDGRTPEQAVDPGNWSTYTAPLDGAAGQYAHELALAATSRQGQLGEAAAIEQPAWTAVLGPVPDAVDAPHERAAWEQRVGIVAAYREVVGIPAEHTSLGEPPSRERPLAHALYQQASHASGHQLDAAGGDVALLSDAELYALRERWTREQAWAPQWVADELAAAYEHSAEAQQDADLTAARLGQLPSDADGRDWVQAQHTAAARDAETYLERAQQLEEVHQARLGWASATAAVEEADRYAASELERRGLPLQRAENRPEQLGLFHEPARFEPAAESAANRVQDTLVVTRGPASDDEAAAALEARAAADIAFRRDLHQQHQRRLAEVDPDGRLDPAAREAALRADNLTRAAVDVRRAHGDRLDPERRLDDEGLLHARAAELAEARSADAEMRAGRRATAHGEVDPDRRYPEDTRDAVLWQRARARSYDHASHNQDDHNLGDRGPADGPRRRDDDPQLGLLDVEPTVAQRVAASPAREQPADRDPELRDEALLAHARDERAVGGEDPRVGPGEDRHQLDQAAPRARASDDRDSGRSVDEQASTLAEARQQARAANEQRGIAEAAALERGRQQQATAATRADDAERVRRGPTAEASEKVGRTEAPQRTATPTATPAPTPPGPRMVRTPDAGGPRAGGAGPGQGGTSS